VRIHFLLRNDSSVIKKQPFSRKIPWAMQKNQKPIKGKDREECLSRGQNSGIDQGKLEMDSARVASWRPYSPEQNREK
jgi:hypothetical protein